MKVLLIQPPYCLFENDHPQAVPPLGLAYLGAVLEQDGHEIHILDCVVEGFEQIVSMPDGRRRVGISDEQLCQQIIAFAPQVVGVSCLFSAQADMAHHVCKLTKQIDASIWTIMGGAHPSSVPTEILADSHVDIVVIGEGEMVLRRLVQDLSKGIFPPADPSALGFREDANIRIYPPTEHIEDLDLLPMPARHLLPMHLYLHYAAPHGGAVKRHPVTNMITSRGCPAKCCFCSIHTVWGRKFRGHSPERVVREIESLVHDYGVREIQFEDDNLTYDRNRIQDICRRIIDRRIDITWSTPNGVAVYALDKSILRLMRQAGCHHISIAVESGCQRVLNEIIHKPLRLSRVAPLVRAARKNGIGVSVFFVIGFPGETMEEIRQTLSYGLKMRVDAVLFFTAMPYPGTELLEDCLARGLLSTPVNYAQMRINHPMFDTKEWRAEELMDMIRVASERLYRRATLRHPLRLLRRLSGKLIRRPRETLYQIAGSFLPVKRNQTRPTQTNVPLLATKTE